MTPVSPRPQVTIGSISPRTSSFDDSDEFDEGASYFGKDMDPLFSPYARDGAPVSKWSLSSSVEMDLQSKRHNTLTSPKGKSKSFISCLSSNSQSFCGDEHDRVVKRSFQSGCRTFQPLFATMYGLWESVPATPPSYASSSTSCIHKSPNSTVVCDSTALAVFTTNIADMWGYALYAVNGAPTRRISLLPQAQKTTTMTSMWPA
ncbi:hypothetical protein APHAL10511_001454 [Amanita phalloides]|nr:hypothetical protein APHAL10511_001454 [Amanita phalloides]